ncbi:unnamed protein product [Trifolium pratense]|uniref:Uncharacterized protein n=1 Tax=Trifolium pratense TaxID=57577 RepID=A0ACB0IBA1_TRIPR|nr:unnamed protein product [Trifolium pratense]
MNSIHEVYKITKVQTFIRVDIDGWIFCRTYMVQVRIPTSKSLLGVDIDGWGVDIDGWIFCRTYLVQVRIPTSKSLLGLVVFPNLSLIILIAWY